MTPYFQGFPKIGRWANSKIAITEKIDGTNASIAISRFAGSAADAYAVDPTVLLAVDGLSEISVERGCDAAGNPIDVEVERPRSFVLRAGSRTRWITPAADNYGFASWAHENAHELMALGEGVHYGEWWGNGIQRKYGSELKYFSLFNTGRWADTPDGVYDKSSGNPLKRPINVDRLAVVPQLYYGPLRDASGACMIEQTAKRLQFAGSQAFPGFDDPEGVMVYFEALKTYAKVPFDPRPKGQI